MPKEKYALMGEVIMAAALIWALWDLAAFFTEKSYISDVRSCRSFISYSGAPAGLPGTDIPMIEVSAMYLASSENSKTAKVVFKQKKDLDCQKIRDQGTLQISVSPLTPSEARPVLMPKDWVAKLGWPFLLIVIGFAMRFMRISRYG